MFQFFFKYPSPVFLKGRFVLLGRWPAWFLLLLIVLSAAGLAILILSRRAEIAPKLKTWRGGVVWLLQSALIALVLLLLWQPAVTVAELTSQQNIIAVLVDDSHSMSVADSGRDGKATRETAAIEAMQGGVLAGLQKRFQTRIYRLDGGVKPVSRLGEIAPSATSTHISDGLHQLATETADLPIGAVVLLSDGAENTDGGGETGGIGVEAINALRNRRLPVHTIGFGRDKLAHDIEMNDVDLAPRTAANARMSATVSFHQRGYSGSKALLVVRDGEKAIASRDVTLGAEGTVQTETIFFLAGAAGARSFQFSIAPLPGEENALNNAMIRLVNVSDEKRRILYVEGEPRWEYKFIRRAEDDDKTVQMVSMLRTTENKIYRQGISDARELEEGFPVRPEDLFAYDAIIIGSVEAGYFTPSQQELLREFVDRRGGGLLFLGGRYSLSEGGWGASGAADLLPTFLPNARGTFHRDPALAALTAAGAESPMMRLDDDRSRNVDRWKKLTYMMDYQEAGSPKPGATVLADLNTGHRTLPLLVTENYGRGRTALLATSGTWRWQMSQPLGDSAHDLFWQQLLRWLVADSRGHVVASVPNPILMDEGRLRLSATVRDKTYMPAGEAHVTAHIIGPAGSGGFVEMSATPNSPGEFHGEWTVEKPGDYLAEVVADRGGDAAGHGSEELGRDVLTFRRSDGVAENFHTEQNRELLERLSAETGGRYWKPDELAKLPTEISYSEAGISVRDTKELWDMPVVLLLLLALMLSEWLLRREWGVV